MALEDRTHTPCPECEPGDPGGLYLTGDRDAVICSCCRTVFTPFEG